jgi:hypothetical protein
MPLSTVSIGHSTRPIQHDVDARWLMAYAAGIGDLNPRYMDTLDRQVVGHPVFPVCLEWPVILASRELPGYDLVTPAERARGVHASHDLHIYRPIRAGDRLTTRATHIGLKRIKPGAAQLTRLDTVDADGALVCRTYQLGISRGVEVLGADAEIEAPPAWPSPAAHRAVRCDASTCRWPRVRRTSTPSARASGIRSTPIARWRSAPDSPTSSCTAPRPSRSRSRGWSMNCSVETRIGCGGSVEGFGDGADAGNAYRGDAGRRGAGRGRGRGVLSRADRIRHGSIQQRIPLLRVSRIFRIPAMIRLKVRKIGNSLGVMLAMSDEEVDRLMQMPERIMDENRELLRALAK